MFILHRARIFHSVSGKVVKGGGTGERNGSSDFYERPSNVPLNANKFSAILRDCLHIFSFQAYAENMRDSILINLLKSKPRWRFTYC